MSLRATTVLLIAAALLIHGGYALTMSDWYPKHDQFIFQCGQGDAEAYNWFFGDGERLLGIGNDNIFHTFQSVGIYTVICQGLSGGTVQEESLEITVEQIPAPAQTVPRQQRGTSDDADGNVSLQNTTDNKTIDKPDLSFSVAPHYPQGTRYVFRCDASGYEPLSYSWEFGDGEQLLRIDRSDVYHDYRYGGNLTARCTAHGENISLSQTMDLSIDAPALPEPDTTSLALWVNQLTWEYDVALRCRASGFSPDTFTWDFGDGTSENSTSERVIHYYSGYGPYEASCTASNQTHTETASATVRPRGPDGIKTDDPLLPAENATATVIELESSEDFNRVFRCEADGMQPTRYVWNIKEFDDDGLARDRNETRNATRIIDGESVSGDTLLHTFLVEGDAQVTCAAQNSTHQALSSPWEETISDPGSENPDVFDHPALRTFVTAEHLSGTTWELTCDPRGFRWFATEDQNIQWRIDLHNGSQQQWQFPNNQTMMNFTFPSGGIAQVKCVARGVPAAYSHDYYLDVVNTSDLWRSVNPMNSDPFTVEEDPLVEATGASAAVIVEVDAEYNKVFSCETKGIIADAYDWTIIDEDPTYGERVREVTLNATRIIDGEPEQRSDLLHTFHTAGEFSVACTARNGTHYTSDNTTIPVNTTISINSPSFEDPWLSVFARAEHVEGSTYDLTCEPWGFIMDDQPGEWVIRSAGPGGDLTARTGGDIEGFTTFTDAPTTQFTFPDEKAYRVICTHSAPPMFNYALYQDVATTARRGALTHDTSVSVPSFSVNETGDCPEPQEYTEAYICPSTNQTCAFDSFDPVDRRVTGVWANGTASLRCDHDWWMHWEEYAAWQGVDPEASFAER